MGGGQAGAPADDDHVPWSRPPRRGHRDRGWSRRGPARALAAGPVHVTGLERADARLRPERPMGGAGAKRWDTAKGLRKTPMKVVHDGVDHNFWDRAWKLGTSQAQRPSGRPYGSRKGKSAQIKVRSN